jgi:hypothetical protein
MMKHPSIWGSVPVHSPLMSKLPKTQQPTK